MNMLGDQQIAIAWVTKLAAIAVLISCAEYIAMSKLLKSGGLISWSVGRLRYRWFVREGVGDVLDVLLKYPNVLGLIGIRAFIAAVILFGSPQIAYSYWIIIPAVIFSGLFILRNNYGQDGADQMLWILFVGLAFVTIVSTSEVKSAYLWFVALQSCLAYFVAGTAKATAKGWRDGSYLIGICGTKIYGHPTLANFLRRNPERAKTLARLLIIWECSFPLVLIMPQPIALVMVGSGLVFHLVNAYFMGLNTFFWSFASTYPAILYCVQVRGW